MNYLMTPELFHQLSNIKGFSKWNGDNYIEHIVLFLNQYYPDLDKSVVLNIRDSIDDKEALDILNDHQIDFCHHNF